MSGRRILFALWPFTGHLLPQMSIAVALRERGHEVAFVSGEAVRETVEAEGFDFFGFRHVDERRAFANMRAMEGGGRTLPILRDWLVETIPDQLRDLREVIAAWRPEAIATDLSLWAPIVVLSETEEIPVALSSTFMGPLIPGPDAPPPGFGLRPPRTFAGRGAARALTRLTELAGRGVRRRVDEIRAGEGLPPLGESVNRRTARLPLYLVGNVRELDYGRRDLPPTVHYVGNCPWYPPARPGTAEWLDAIPSDRPWVHVTESTLSHGDPFLLRAAIEGLAGEPVELIVTTGGRLDRDSVGADPPPNVHVADWVDHGTLLPRCSALVTVGGKATVMAAAEVGVPMVVVPTTWDKPDNARRVTEAGLGVRLTPRRCTPPRLRAAVREVLDEPRYRRAAERVAALLAAAPGPARAAELLERLASEPAAAPSPPVPRRPRPLAHLGRWGRARRWLPADSRRVLDVGCSYGYGAAAIAARGPAGRVVVGVERDPEHVATGRRRYPWLTLLEGDAAALPAPDASADAVLMLDVVEHLPDPAGAIAEARRVLRPGGVLILSVPHRGLLRRLDALNVYESLRRRRPSWPALEPSAATGGNGHLHYTREELERLLRPGFAVERTARTGLGLTEVVHLGLLALRVMGLHRLCRALMPLHFVAYVAEDVVPTGRAAYHLTARARALPSGAER